jgi:hypothetical protein
MIDNGSFEKAEEETSCDGSASGDSGQQHKPNDSSARTVANNDFNDKIDAQDQAWRGDPESQERWHEFPEIPGEAHQNLTLSRIREPYRSGPVMADGVLTSEGHQPSSQTTRSTSCVTSSLEHAGVREGSPHQPLQAGKAEQDPAVQLKSQPTVVETPSSIGSPATEIYFADRSIQRDP